MRYTYLYSFKCGAIERNEVDLDWIYIDIWMVMNREDEKKRKREKRNCGSFVWGGKNAKVPGRYLLEYSLNWMFPRLPYLQK